MFLLKVITWLNKEINDKNVLGATKISSSNNHHLGMSHFGRPMSAFASGNNSIQKALYTKTCATPDLRKTTANYGLRSTGVGLCPRRGVYTSQVTPHTESEIPKSIPIPSHFPVTDDQARHFIPSAINVSRS